MKIIFFGTSAFALPSLEAISRSAHTLVSVVTQPDKRGGRTHRQLLSSVKQWALENKVHLLQPPDLSGSSFRETLKAFRPDLFVVVSYGKILPPALLALPPLGGVNVHPSLLPKYRGASPISWAILNGDPKTGLTVIRLSEEVDAGEILLQKEVALGEEDALQLSERLSRLGGELLSESLDRIAKGKAVFIPQKGEMSIAPRFKKEDGAIDWKKSAKILSREIRAFVPWPGSYSYLGGKRLLIWKAKAIEGGAGGHHPGEVVGFSEGGEIIMATGKGKLLIEALQLEGKEKMPSRSFLIGHRLRIGETFACNPRNS